MPTFRTIPVLGVSLWEYIKIQSLRFQNESNKGIIIGQQPVQCVLSAADLIGMNATPLPVLSLPGLLGVNPANVVILPNKFCLQVQSTATAFTGGGAISLVYHGTSVTPFATVPATALTAGTSTLNLAPTAGSTYQPVAGVGLDLTNVTAAFAAGTGMAILTVFYDLLVIN